MKIEFFKHNLGATEIKAITKVLKSTFLTTGPVTRELEENLAKYLKCQEVIGVTSCTAALFLTLKACDIGPGDEVITTPLTFIATANAILHAGAQPVFIDVEKSTGNLDANLIEKATTQHTKAIIPVHLYGQMCDMSRIKKIATKHHLIIIEDAAHALEAQRDHIRVGQLSQAACFSFYATKNITCGEGGAISTNNPKIAQILKMMRLHGMNKSAADRYTKKYQHWDMEILGWKYNLDDIKASLLLNQLKNIEKYWQKREAICQKYETAFNNVPNIDLLTILPNSKSSRHLFTILVPAKKRDTILWSLQQKGIGVAVNYRPVHLTKYYRKTFHYKPGVFPTAENIGERTITLPLYPKLTAKEVQYIIKSVKEAVASLKLCVQN